MLNIWCVYKKQIDVLRENESISRCDKTFSFFSYYAHTHRRLKFIKVSIEKNGRRNRKETPYSFSIQVVN